MSDLMNYWQQSEMRFVLFLCSIALLLACPDPELRLKFDDHGELRDPLHIVRKSDNVELYIMGWTEYRDTAEYELTLGVEIRFDAPLKGIAVQSDSIKVQYNSESMISEGIRTWDRDNDPERGKYAFSKLFVCRPGLDNLPRSDNGAIKDVRMAISLTGLIQVNGVPLVFDTVVAWERKAKRLSK
jgi:hypothetical protein